jgi:hypothetical protein
MCGGRTDAYRVSVGRSERRHKLEDNIKKRFSRREMKTHGIN